MKKSSLKTLKLNKTAICNLENVKGGLRDADDDCTCTCETKCEQANCCTCASNCC
ncbi:hypothetical protein IMCC3317_42560 [Kordia antarctica]|uniref:Uncharacterized protein n=1 Tax=Kordia antarctica TaxID=1218801 RepID=A0A7L4ZRM1_9FLAO|nr:hypothetical protein [Kordia antarctica]QHI38856.1 hypothetical protein IMCC3317_42560 [Kordia antarctica]